MNQDNAAISAIETRITERQTALTDLEGAIAALEEKKKQKEADLPHLKADLEALRRTLAILKGTTHGEQIATTTATTSTTSTTVPGYTPGSNTDFARKILLQAGGPLRMPILLTKAEEIKPGLNKRSFSANIYRLASEGKVFKVEDMQITLIEWERGKITD